MNPLMRFRPYIRTNDIILFERLREATGISIGKILMSLLVESETFVKLSQCTDATEQELKDIFRGLYPLDDLPYNKDKKVDNATSRDSITARDDTQNLQEF